MPDIILPEDRPDARNAGAQRKPWSAPRIIDSTIQDDTAKTVISPAEAHLVLSTASAS